MDKNVGFNTEEHVIDALELVLEKLQESRAKPMAWKWVVIGMHTAFHGGFVLVLRRSDGIQLLPEKKEWAVFESWQRERASGQFEDLHFDFVDPFMQLYAKTKIDWRMSYLGGTPLEATAKQDECVDRLNTYRGSLTHFSDTSLSLEVERLLEIIQELLPVLRFYYFETQHGTFLYPQHAARAKSLLASIEVEIGNIRNEMEEGFEDLTGIPVVTQ